MNEEDKPIFPKSIEDLYANWSINISSGFEKALGLLTHDYSLGDRLASIICLSDEG